MGFVPLSSPEPSVALILLVVTLHCMAGGLGTKVWTVFLNYLIVYNNTYMRRKQTILRETTIWNEIIVVKAYSLVIHVCFPCPIKGN